MLSYFPKVYPGEILYSVLARYGLHIGNPGPMHTMDALFGNRKVVATFDMPGHLQLLADRIPSDRGLSVNQIIDTLTLFPYFTAFAPPVVQEKVRDSMRSGAVGGLHVSLGLSAFRIGRNQWLRFCPDCIQEMQAAHDELWWRRDHQLPGILVCPKHACLLRDSDVSFSQFSRHGFIAATLKNCTPHARSVVQLIDQKWLEQLQGIARRSAELLCNPPAGRTLDRWTAFYRSQMLETGFSKSIAIVDQYRFQAEFRKFYGGLLEVLPSAMDNGNLTGWLASMVRKHRKISHPLQHVLVQNFLSHQVPLMSPFGSGPWPCINPLAKHTSDFPIKVFAQHVNRGNKVGVFSCDCGYVYTRCLDFKTGLIGLPRFKRYGPLLAPVLREFVSAGAGLRHVGRCLGLDPKTVVRLARELDINLTYKPASISRVPPVLMGLAEKCSPLFATRKRSTDQCSVRRPRKDWLKVDDLLFAKITAWIDNVFSERPPVRITFSELERRMGKRGWLARNLNNLPKTKEYLDRAVESTGSFQLRRIHWAIDELERSGVQIKAWRVMRKAGLNTEKLTLINEVLAAVPRTARLFA